MTSYCPETRRAGFSHGSAGMRRLEDATGHAQCRRCPMLPMTVQFLIAMVAHAINERMARRVDYLVDAQVLEAREAWHREESRDSPLDEKLVRRRAPTTGKGCGQSLHFPGTSIAANRSGARTSRAVMASTACSTSAPHSPPPRSRPSG